MASRPLLLALLATSTLASSDFEFHLTPEILTFVPPCARECFISFLSVNYDNPCNSTTSLTCLCQKRGLSGFTIAEGLVQCIAAERAIGFCNEKDGGNEKVLEAFGLCDEKEGAVSATNTVFTATLIMPSKGPGVVRFPPLRTTTILESSTWTSEMSMTRTRTEEVETETLVREPDETTSRATSSTFETRTTSSTEIEETTSDSTAERPTTTSQTSTFELTTSTPTPTPASDKADEQESSPPPLNKAQIAGLSTGLVSLALLTTLLILLARRSRKRHRNSNSYTPQSPKPPFFKRLFATGGGGWPYKRNREDDDSGSLDGVARQVNDPLSPTGGAATGYGGGVNGPYGKGGAEVDEKQKRNSAEEAGYDWQSWWPAAIGLAMSGDRERYPEKEVASRRQSKLLPAKPEYVLPAQASARRNSPGPMSPATFQGATMVPAPKRATTPQNKTSKEQAALNYFTPSPSPPRNLMALRASPSSPSPPPKAHLNTNKPQPPAPLTLTIPKNSSTSNANNPLTRDSVFTQFEEDGSAVASTVPAGSQIWVPPSAGPDGATGPLYYSDANGNWVLRSASVNGKTMIAGERNAANGKTGGEPTEEQKAAAQGLMPAAEITRDPRSQASSVYSQQTPATVPRPLFSGPRRTQRRSSNPPMPPMPRRESDDSGVTQFSGGSHSSSSSDPVPPPPGSLSPVVESPPSARPGKGVAEKIDTVRGPENGGVKEGTSFSERANRGLMPPRAERAYHPPGQPSPTLGMMSQQPATKSSQNEKPQTSQQDDAVFSVPPASKPSQQPQSILKPPNPTLRLVRPSPEPEDPFTDEFTTAPAQPQDRDMLPSSRRRVSFSAEAGPAASPTPSSYNTWRPPKPAQHAQQREQQWDQEQPRQYARPHFRQPSGPYYQQSHHGGTYQTLHDAPGPRPHPSHVQPQPHHRAPTQPRAYPAYPPSRNSLNNPNFRDNFVPNSSSSASTPTSQQTSQTSQTSSSSLLAKRLGPGKAADMALSSRPRSTQSKWQQHRSGGLETPRGAWLPTLTPTRRGDDLYLNVQ